MGVNRLAAQLLRIVSEIQPPNAALSERQTLKRT
jgi:hypothetical protein